MDIGRGFGSFGGLRWVVEGSLRALPLLSSGVLLCFARLPLALPGRRLVLLLCSRVGSALSLVVHLARGLNGLTAMPNQRIMARKGTGQEGRAHLARGPAGALFGLP